MISKLKRDDVRAKLQSALSSQSSTASAAPQTAWAEPAAAAAGGAKRSSSASVEKDEDGGSQKRARSMRCVSSKALATVDGTACNGAACPQVDGTDHVDSAAEQRRLGRVRQRHLAGGQPCNRFRRPGTAAADPRDDAVARGAGGAGECGVGGGAGAQLQLDSLIVLQRTLWCDARVPLRISLVAADSDAMACAWRRGGFDAAAAEPDHAGEPAHQRGDGPRAGNVHALSQSQAAGATLWRCASSALLCRSSLGAWFAAV